MIENRPIVAITIGYILGIIMGLYCKISIVFLYLFFFSIYLIFNKPRQKEFKLISLRRYSRYFKIVFTKNVIIIIVLSSIFSNVIILIQNEKYENIYSKMQDIEVRATVVSNPKEKEYKNVYKIKVEAVNGDLKYKNTELYLSVKKNVRKLEYGEKIKISGTFEEPQSQRNYRGFDYKEYLKTQKIYGTVNLKNVEKLENPKMTIFRISNEIFLKVKENIQKSFDKTTSNVLLGLTFGYTDEIDEYIKFNFSESNLSHILAVSGMHIGFIVLFINLLFEKLLGKKYSKIITSIFLIFYMFLTGFSSSVVRASIMAEIHLLSYILHKKNDLWQNLCLSLLILLIYNPFLVENVGVLLTFLGTIGIAIKPKSLDIGKNGVIKKIKNMIQVTIFVTFLIVPIMAIYFNKIPIASLLISTISEIIVGPIIILVFLKIFILDLVSIINLKLLSVIICKLTQLLLNIAEFGSKMPLNKIYVVTPNITQIIIYYFILFFGLFLDNIYKAKKLSLFQKRVKNLVSLFKFRFYQNRRKVISAILVLIMIFNVFKIIPKNLKIYFIDVGQGDSCLIITPQNKTILIDGGGSKERRI